MIPFEMEKVSGIKMMAKKAGMASSRRSHSIERTGFIIKAPTNTKGAAVAMEGITDKRGDRKKNGRKRRPATTDTSPVLPPCWIPAADSI